MTKIIRYAGEGTFSTSGSFEWDSPEVGSRHKFFLFIAQEAATPRQLIALQEAGRYGFVDIELEEGELVVAEAMKAPQLQVFAQYYEGALNEGSSLVCLPNWQAADA
jgi:hypothetical protein